MNKKDILEINKLESQPNNANITNINLFDLITQITTPSFNDNVSGYYNLPYPITIIQYKK